MFTVHEFDLARGKVPGCCGMEFHHFHAEGNYDKNGMWKPASKEGTFSIEKLMEQLVLPPEKAKLYGMPWYIKPVVIFSGTDNQEKAGGNNAFSFAAWLRKEGEKDITESPYHVNYGARIKLFVWNVSDAFTNRIKAAYEAKYGTYKVPTKVGIAIAHHDRM